MSFELLTRCGELSATSHSRFTMNGPTCLKRRRNERRREPYRRVAVCEEIEDDRLLKLNQRKKHVVLRDWKREHTPRSHGSGNRHGDQHPQFHQRSHHSTCAITHQRRLIGPSSLS